MDQRRHDERGNTAPERSVLAMLRALVPRRPLSPSETLWIAERQANRLLDYFAIQTDAVPEEIVSELPRIRVVHEIGLPMSGCAHWDGRFWVIVLSDDEHPLRRRFSLMHEFKHVLDHTTRDWLYRERPYMTAREHAERVADYFAACLLMPKRVVKRLWFSGPQSVNDLAEKLQVSPAAARYRLYQLGLIEKTSRCEWQSSRYSTRAPYRRPALAGASGGRR